MRLDTPDHRAHLTYPTADRCPGTHPVSLPMLEVKLMYRVPAGALRAALSTGDASSLTVGFVAGWPSATPARLVSTCIDRGLRCGVDGAPA